MNFIKKHQINKQKVVEVEKKQVEATNDIWILREDVKKINNNKLLINDNHRNSKFFFLFLLTNCNNNIRISK
jgi:hypothetical protein